MLSPTSDNVLQHLKHVNYQTLVWRKALTAIQHLLQPEKNEWVRDSPSVKPVYMAKEPAPSSLLELITCTCKGGWQNNCSCNNAGLSVCHVQRHVIAWPVLMCAGIRTEFF